LSCMPSRADSFPLKRAPATESTVLQPVRSYAEGAMRPPRRIQRLTF
jgi:hypothetical protein